MKKTIEDLTSQELLRNDFSSDSEEDETDKNLPENLQQSNYTNRRFKPKQIDGIPYIQFAMKGSDFQQDWFHKKATRETAVKLLQRKEAGTFLVRYSKFFLLFSV